MQKATRTLILSITILICLVNQGASLKAQSSEYTIESFQDDGYTELTSYHSIALLTGWHPFWSYEFDFGFPFPFYDSTYNNILFRYNGWGSFTDNEDTAIFLMEYGWTQEDFVDTINIPSDVRFSQVVEDGIQAFVIQYTQIRLFADPFEDSLNTYLNFQYWFYENGYIEVKFGEIHMDNTPIYAPGKGLYGYTSSEGVDTNEVCGPHMGIGHPLDEENAIGFEGAYNDYEVYPDQYGFLTEFPPPGWVIRFKPTFVSTTRLEQSFQEVVLSPNPTIDYINLPAIATNISIYDGTGKLVFMQSQQGKEVDVSTLSAGIQYIHFISEGRQFAGKFVRQ